jgi:hypothetical protein
MAQWCPWINLMRLCCHIAAYGSSAVSSTLGDCWYRRQRYYRTFHIHNTQNSKRSDLVLGYQNLFLVAGALLGPATGPFLLENYPYSGQTGEHAGHSDNFWQGLIEKSKTSCASFSHRGLSASDFLDRSSLILRHVGEQIWFRLRKIFMMGIGHRNPAKAALSWWE